MNNVEFVHVLNTFDELPEEFAGFAFFESFFLDDLLKEFTLRDELHDEEELFGGFDNFVELDKIGVSDLFEDVYFAGDSFYIGNIDNFIFFKYFDGNFFSRYRVNTKFDFAEGALSKIFGNNVVSDGSGFLE